MNITKIGKNLLKPVLIALGLSAVLVVLSLVLLHPGTQSRTESVAVKQISTNILADGSVASQNETTLTFLTPGRLSYLPLKEGDTVYQGETIASLDTYALQRQVELAANAYETTKNNADTTAENFQAGVLEGQQRTSFDTTNKNSYNNITEAQVITDEVKRIVDNANINQNSAQLATDLANYAQSLATLTSPINGILTREDVSVPNVNVTPATTFVVSDPNTMVFRAQISDQDIDFVSVGASATVYINGNKQKFTGVVTLIHPQKQTINGQGIYLVDIVVDGLQNEAKFGQGGFAQIKSNVKASTKLVPFWVVLNNQSVWVRENGKDILKHVSVGKTHGNMIEILGGLGRKDTIIVNPESVVSKYYSIL